jgi:hypothetical protein
LTTLEVAVDIDAPPERTWAVVTDWGRQGEWMPMTNVSVTADHPMGVGATIRARSGVGPVGFVDPMVIEVWQPPHRCEVVHLGRVVTGRGVFVVEPLPGDRSRFVWREELDSARVRSVLDRVAAPVSKALLRVALRRLARIAASEAG